MKMFNKSTILWRGDRYRLNLKNCPQDCYGI